MANNLPNQEVEDIFAGNKDDSIDVLAAIKDIENSTKAEEVVDDPEIVDELDWEPIEPKPARAPKKELTPLEQARLAKEQGTSGMVISNKELADGANKGPTKDIVHGTREKEFSDSFDDFDKTLNKRKAVVIVKRPVSQVEYMQMMQEIEAIRFKADGSAYFDIGPSIKDENEQYIESHVLDEGYHLQYVRLRTENDPPFEEDELSKNFNVDNVTQKVTLKTEEEKAGKEPATETTEDAENKEEGFAISEESKKNIQIIID